MTLIKLIVVMCSLSSVDLCTQVEETVEASRTQCMAVAVAQLPDMLEQRPGMTIRSWRCE